jgi:L-ribulose-5-phosphate 3-epimerase
MSETPLTRRSFLKQSTLAGGALALSGKWIANDQNFAASPSISVFSKHLQFLNLRELSDAVVEMGFDGIDLSVRPNGHVEPEQVAERLPEAVAEMKRVGLKPLLMTSAVADAANPVDQKVLEVASAEGIQYYRMDYFRYHNDRSIPDSVSYYQDRIKALSQLNESLDLTGCYQNHAGNYIGSTMWELYLLLNKVENSYLGIQYDIRHAVVEGGMSWQNGFRLVEPRISMFALKDFRWEKSNGQWRVVNCPIGEGMVDFTAFFKLVKTHRVRVPFSLHFEYPLGGAERGNQSISVDRKVVFESMRRDLVKVRELWRDA